MKSSEYWQRRFDELEAALLRKGERYNASEVERQFKMAMAAIEKEISYWYQRLGSNNGVSAAEARRLLSADELREFHWTVEEYIKYGRTAGFTDKWMKQLENASAKAHISRLDAIKLQIQQQLEVLYGNQVDGLDRLMRDIYTEGYNRSAYTIDKGMGVHYNLASTDSGRIDTIINQPWAGDGKIFSDRLWRDKDKLVNTLQQEMTQAVTRGDKLGDAVKKIASRMNVAKSSAARLVMTESAFISGRSQRDCFKGLGVDKYEYVATLDRKTSEICQEMDGKVFDIDDYKPGTNAPPMHCWCRSCIAPYFDDEEIGERAARDPKTGKTVRVPGEMTYREWEKKYGDKADIKVYAGVFDDAKKFIYDILGVETHELKEYISFNDLPTTTRYTKNAWEGVKANIKEVNPNYGKAKAYSENCTLCVSTMELRIKGYDVVAKAYDYWNWNDNVDMIMARPYLPFKNAKVIRALGDNIQRKKIFEKHMHNWGHNARAIIAVSGEENGHVIFAVNDNGVIRYCDPQMGSLNAKDYFSFGDEINIEYFRVDNLDFDEDYLYTVCERRR